MKNFLYILVFFTFLIFPVKAKNFEMVVDSDGGVWFYNIYSGEVWTCGFSNEHNRRICERAPIEIGEIPQQLKNKGFDSKLMEFYEF